MGLHGHASRLEPDPVQHESRRDRPERSITARIPTGRTPSFLPVPFPITRRKIVGIVTGHHVGRVGELMIFDPAQGRYETDGVVQRIPGYGQKVEPLIEDKLTEHSWPKFVHPYPLSEKHFLVSCKPTPDSLWGIYLVDVFDNMVLLKEEERHVLLEPIPLRATHASPR